MSTILPKTVRLKNGKTVVIRSARPSDAQQMLEHARTVMAESEFLLTTPEDFHMTREQEKSWIKANTDAPGKVIIVAETEGKLIGMLNFRNGERKRIAHQGEFGMSVHRNWRDQGVGRSLLTALIEWAEQQPSIEKVGLQVFATNTRGIALYKSLGFQEEGRLLKDVKLGPGSYVDVIVMGKFVKDV